MPPEFLAVGYIARDESPHGAQIGGAVAYGAFTALKMGLRAAVVTSAARDLDIAGALPGVDVHLVASAKTTTFYYPDLKGRRRQYLRSAAAPIAAADVPAAWTMSPLVLLGPLAGELSLGVSRLFPESLVAASIQGWLRHWGADGLVSPRYWEGRELLPYVEAATVSVEDVADEQLVPLWAGLAKVLIVTNGSDGARLHLRGRWHDVAPFQAREVDPTGAGDVFAAAYLIRLRERQDPVESAKFASSAASFCVEGEGLAGVPTRNEVEQRLKGLAG